MSKILVVEEQQTLKVALKRVSLATLRSIANHWGLKAPQGEPSTETHQLIEYLVPRLQAAQYFRPAIDKLDQHSKDLIYFIAIHGGELFGSELIRRCCGKDPTLFLRWAEDLERKGFVFSISSPRFAENLYFLPSSHLQLIELPQHCQGFLGALLQSLDSAQLAKIAERVLGPEMKIDSPALLRHAIREKLLNPAALKFQVASLSDPERELFNVIIERKGFCLYRDLLDSSGQKRFDHGKAEHLNLLVTSSGLLYASSDGENKYTNMLTVPRDLYHIVTNGFIEDERPVADLDTISEDRFSPESVMDNSQALLRDIALLGGYIDTQKIKRLAAGGISKIDLKRALGFLSAGKSVKYASFLAEFMTTAKLAIGVSEEWTMSENFGKWLADPAQCHRDIYGWWLSSTTWNDELGAPAGSSPGESGQGVIDILELRRLALKGMAGLARGRWVNTAAFVDSLLPQVDGALPNRGGSRANARKKAQTLLHAIVSESLNWLGLLNIGYDSKSVGVDNLPDIGPKRKLATGRKVAAPKPGGYFFQQSRIGLEVFQSDFLEPRRLYGDGESPPFSHGSKWLLVQPNLEISIPPDMALPDVYYLSRFCETRTVDVMTTFEMTRDSLRRGMEQGLTSREILAFLEPRSRMTMPETVKHLVEECSERHGEARLGTTGGYITSSDPLVIEEIRANPKLSVFIKDTVGDSVILLAPNADLSRVEKELRNAGLMPLTESSTVHATGQDSYHLTVSAQELYDLIASTRLIAHVEEVLGADITEGRAASLTQKLKPDGADFETMNRYTEANVNAFQKRFNAAFQKLTEDVAEKYKSQVSRLVSKSLSGRAPSKYLYKGSNPASGRDDIIALLNFALEHEIEAEILYVKQNDEESKIVVLPNSFEGDRVYAHCPATDNDAIYAIKRILRAQLV